MVFNDVDNWLVFLLVFVLNEDQYQDSYYLQRLLSAL